MLFFFSFSNTRFSCACFRVFFFFIYIVRAELWCAGARFIVPECASSVCAGLPCRWQRRQSAMSRRTNKDTHSHICHDLRPGWVSLADQLTYTAWYQYSHRFLVASVALLVLRAVAIIALALHFHALCKSVNNKAEKHALINWFA